MGNLTENCAVGKATSPARHLARLPCI